tara:strand:- start:9265 stop:9951 length:687 start_codon:yes stop_codon:yes gene_type:complete
MRRIVEPELMNDLIQVLEYSQADFAGSDNAFLNNIKSFISLEEIELDEGSIILDIGCGPGNISQRIAEEFKNIEVLAFDGSYEMIKIANQRKFGKKINNLRYVCSDIRKFNLDEYDINNKLALIVSNSFIHHLHNSKVLWDFLKQISKKTFHTIHRDLRRPKNEEELILLLEKNASNWPPILVKDYTASLKAAFTLKEIESQILENKLSNLSFKECGDQYLEIYGSIL